MTMFYDPNVALALVSLAIVSIAGVAFSVSSFMRNAVVIAGIAATAIFLICNAISNTSLLMAPVFILSAGSIALAVSWSQARAMRIAQNQANRGSGRPPVVAKLSDTLPERAVSDAKPIEKKQSAPPKPPSAIAAAETSPPPRGRPAHHFEEVEALAKERTLFMLRQSKKLRIALKEQETLNDLQRSFVTMLSHEFRTPLAIMDSSAQKLKSRAATMTPDDIGQRADSIRAAIKGLTALMEKILASAKYEDGNLPLKFRRFNLRDIITHACNKIAEISPSHRIEMHIEELPEILGDKEALDQLLENLLTNAVKYSPGKDHIDVRVTADNETIRIEVEDYGLGIDEDDVPKLFNRFYRARTSEGIEGTGVGLSLVKKIAEQHGGHAAVESRKGKGTKFIITLPIADSVSQPDEQAVA